jgi:PAS domain S-box-containing protein
MSTEGEPLLARLLDLAEVGTAIIGPEGRFLHVNPRMAAINGVPEELHVGRTVAEVLPDLAPKLDPLIAQVLRTGERVLSIVITGSTTGTRDRHWQASYLPLETIAGRSVGAVVFDVTDRVDAAAEAQRRVRQQSLVADLGQRALRIRAIDHLLDVICSRVQEELDADFTGVMFRAPEGGELVMRAGAGWPPGAMGTVRAPLGRGSQAGFSIEVGGPVILRDPDAEDRFEVSAEMRSRGILSAISTPIHGETEPLGVFGVLSRLPARFDDDDAAFVRSVAHVLGSAIANEDQRGQLERLAAERGRLVGRALEASEREQRQVADLLHDEVLQHLLSARLELSDGETPSLDRIRDSIERAAEIVRSVTASLHPVTLSHAGLAVAIERIAAEHADRGRIDVSFDVEPDAEGPSDRLLISLVRELLNNVVKHAGATRAAVTVRVDGEGRIVVRVSDDGSGIPPGAVAGATAQGSFGLAYARERVEALGGSLVAGPGDGGRGSTVAVTLPRA